jgi:hypothetical protein
MDYLIVILGVLLLALPAEAFSRKKMQNISLHDLMQRVRFKYAWLHWVNAVDLLRAWGGVYVLKVVSGRIAPSVPLEIVWISLVGGAACVGLTIKQLLYSDGEDDLLAPCAYLIGVTIVFVPALAAVLAFSLGVVVAMGLRSLAVGFTVAGLLTGVLGAVLRVPPLVAACPGLLLLSPAFCAVMLQRRLVVAVRPSYGTRNAPLREVTLQRQG